MVSTFTANVQLEEPARGDDVGTWDTPVNGNITNLDLLIGGIATIPLTNANVVLSAGQYRCKTLTFTGALTAGVSITFPTSFTKSYEVQNLCTGSSAFYVVLTTGVGASQYIAAPPGQIAEVLNDGTNVKLKDNVPIGSYVDFANTSVPQWVAASNPNPYLNCNGTTFSAATYPALTAVLGGTTLPDTRGRTRYAADAGTGRINGVIGAPNTVGTGGGDQNTQSHSHANTVTINDPGHLHGISGPLVGAFQVVGGGVDLYGTGFSGGGWGVNTNGAFTGITATANNASYGSGGAQNIPPMYIGGITMIRAG